MESDDGLLDLDGYYDRFGITLDGTESTNIFRITWNKSNEDQLMGSIRYIVHCVLFHLSINI